jgi:hypothetical protein
VFFHFRLRLGILAEPSYLPLAHGEFSQRDEKCGGVARVELISYSGEKRSIPSFSTMVSGEARTPPKLRSVRECLRGQSWLRPPSLLFALDAATGLSTDGKEDGGGTESGTGGSLTLGKWWPLWLGKTRLSTLQCVQLTQGVVSTNLTNDLLEPTVHARQLAPLNPRRPS